MPVAERRSSPLLQLLDIRFPLSFPQYEHSLSQEIPPGSKVYLIHFEEPLKHARHYLGYSKENVRGRVEQHRNGNGARLMEAIRRNGITWHVSRTWIGGRGLERTLKDQHNASHLCSTCRQERIFEQTLSTVVNPITKERRPLRRDVRIQLSLWEK